MSSLPNAANATLYHLDCTYLTDVRYERENLDTISIFFSEQPSEQFPERFFLMPEGTAYDYRAFIFTRSEEIHPDKPSPSEGNVRYRVHAVTNDIPEQRKNYRVYVTFQASVLLEGEKKETSVVIKDIGTGGFQFISRHKFEPDTTLTTIFTSIKTPVCITARIQKQRPIRKDGFYGYGCQFLNLPPKAEMLIRNFVFQTDAIQAKAKKEKESASVSHTEFS